MHGYYMSAVLPQVTKTQKGNESSATDGGWEPKEKGHTHTVVPGARLPDRDVVRIRRFGYNPSQECRRTYWTAARQNVGI